MSLLTRIFPIPNFITLPAVGIDFSAAAMRLVELTKTNESIVPVRCEEVLIPPGCMQGGRVSDEKRFTEFLKTAKKEHNLKYVRVAIPESQVYLFTLEVDTLALHDVRGAIELSLEEYIPLKAIEAVFDFSILKVEKNTALVQVVAVAEATTRTLFSCFMNAGITPVSFELDAQAIARSVVPWHTEGSHMIVDIGAHRSGITVTVAGKAVYTTTIEFGGEMLTQTLSSKLGITPEAAEEMKRSVGLNHTGDEKFFDTLSVAIGVLKDEINRRFIYWHDKKGEIGTFPRIESVLLCGGHSNLRGLADYLAASLKLPVVQANPWTNCFSFEEYIPDISLEKSMSYITAIGLALTDYNHD